MIGSNVCSIPHPTRINTGAVGAELVIGGD